MLEREAHGRPPFHPLGESAQRLGDHQLLHACPAQHPVKVRIGGADLVAEQVIACQTFGENT
jgi:hypothetical protein